MMFGLPFGVLVEGSVSVLLAVTIGYCAVLNTRLKRLQADRNELRQMVADLVHATDLANAAVKELQNAAAEAELALNARLEEAERFGVELANHVSAGHEVMERIARITAVAQSARQGQAPAEIEVSEERPAHVPGTSKLQSALRRLAERERERDDAA
ncbi:MAG TPA: DUF6468 domain-containing protein [Devosia sp.]|nr:DUF6468 domain-containing protein [Devosia sp.]